MLSARLGPGDQVYCGRARCRGLLPHPAPKVVRWAPGGQVNFELDGWKADDAGVLRRVGRRRTNRAAKQVGANMFGVGGQGKGKVWNAATSAGRQALSLPVPAACPRCGAINTIDDRVLID